MDELIAAYTPDQAERLTGVSRSRMANWYRAGLLTPRYVDDGWLKVKYLFSFRDLVALRTILVLCETYRVPLQRLRKVNDYLQARYEEPWSTLTLYVLNRDVFFDEPTSALRMSGTRPGQEAIPFPIASVLERERERVDAFNARGADEVGKLERDRRRVYIAGTRISASTIESFLEAGDSTEEILRQYPSLQEPDIAAVRSAWESRRRRSA